jgi:hypothetical protein
MLEKRFAYSCGFPVLTLAKSDLLAKGSCAAVVPLSQLEARTPYDHIAGEHSDGLPLHADDCVG